MRKHYIYRYRLREVARTVDFLFLSSLYFSLELHPVLNYHVYTYKMDGRLDCVYACYPQ